MSDQMLSRRRALQIAGVTAVPGLLLNCGHSSSLAAPIAGNSSGAAQPAPIATGPKKAETLNEAGQESKSPHNKEPKMDLGAFSVSLAVKDLEASRKFYEKFGFKAFAGKAADKWLILKNGDHVIGLFQGLFEKNIMTFNPGWDQNAQKLAKFTDIRELQRQLKSQGVKLVSEADESTTGPASFMAVDPDGNQILFDQHV